MHRPTLDCALGNSQIKGVYLHLTNAGAVGPVQNLIYLYSTHPENRTDEDLKQKW
jgi:hypothetical protein